MCNPDVDVPRVSLTFSPEELQKTVERSREYLRHMHLLAKMKTISREEKVSLHRGTKVVFVNSGTA